MKKEIPAEWIEQHKALKLEWVKRGCPKSFYEWLLNRIESHEKIKA